MHGFFDRVAVCDMGAYEVWPSELSVDDVEITEGNSGTKNMVFELRLSHPSVETIKVSYETANESARAGLDYYGMMDEVSLNPGNLGAKINVGILGDRIKENDEALLFYIIPS